MIAFDNIGKRMLMQMLRRGGYCPLVGREPVHWKFILSGYQAGTGNECNVGYSLRILR